MLGLSRPAKVAKPSIPTLSDDFFEDVPLDRTTAGYARIMTNLTVGQELPWDRYRNQLNRHIPFLEAKLGVPAASMVVAEVKLQFEDLFLREYLPQLPMTESPILAAGGSVVKAWEVAAASEFPFLDVEPNFLPQDDAGESVTWEAEWGDLPVVVWFHDFSAPVAFVRLPFADSNSMRARKAELLIASRPVLAEALAIIGKLTRIARKKKKRIYVPNGPDQSFQPNSRWDELVLDPEVKRLICSDFQMFLQRREWFEANNIPYRRGYLLHGAPGNGKTSLVRMIASDRRLSATTLNWGDGDANDNSLSEMFEWANEHAPAIVIMEDLDRHFSYGATAERLHRITMARLLNCLDGISTADGVIVIATANDPSKLDPAILSRPGRFDRVVELQRPSAELRRTYIDRHLSGGCDTARLEQMAQKSAGFSFAQLREAYILAGQLAYDGTGVVTEIEMAEAIAQLSAATTKSKPNGIFKKDVGFSAERPQSLT